MSGSLRTTVSVPVSLTLAFLIGGCSSTTAAKPDSKTSPSSSAAAAARKTDGSAKKVQTSKPATSSLEALRQGQSPPAGPLKEIYFDFDRYDLRADARETLKSNAVWLKANASARVEIEGHADERGTSEYNMALGAKRAQAVRDYLVTLGVPTNRLTTISYGEEIPACREQTEQCWQMNRRARFAVKGTAPTT
jgi:peptidoglycan-associated lipoprotein